jgi:hypothetical protein
MELVFGSQLVTVWEEYRGYGHGYKWFREKVNEVIGMEPELEVGDTPTPITEEVDAEKVKGVEEDEGGDGGEEDEEDEEVEEDEEDEEPGPMHRGSEHGDRHDRHRGSEHGDRHDRHRGSEHGDRHDRHRGSEHGHGDHGRAHEIEDDRIDRD